MDDSTTGRHKPDDEPEVLDQDQDDVVAMDDDPMHDTTGDDDDNGPMSGEGSNSL